MAGPAPSFQRPSSKATRTKWHKNKIEKIAEKKKSKNNGMPHKTTYQYF
jgi:hypothetical protein